MQLNMLKCKLHQARVTNAELDYDGSCAIDSRLLELAGIVEFEQIQIYNITNGARLVTYALEAPAGSGMICINGAAARLASPGDRVIIVSYCQLDETEARSFRPRVVLLGEGNSILPL